MVGGRLRLATDPHRDERLMPPMVEIKVASTVVTSLRGNRTLWVAAVSLRGATAVAMEEHKVLPRPQRLWSCLVASLPEGGGVGQTGRLY